jgi:asparagine synthase (glutamine-hydrolysing)
VSGIFGLIRLDGQPIEAETLRAMRAAMAYWGPDGGGVWHARDAGLGQMLLYNTPEAHYERMPLLNAGGQRVLVAAARLDNRAELCDLFAVPHSERPTMPDGQLILRAYEKWGDECPSHLLGDWAFAAWEQRRRTLFLARDQLGNTALYYYYDSRCFAFASSVKALLTLPQVRRQPSELSIAQLLVLYPVEGAASLHEPIQPLPPAHYLTLTPSHMSVRQYWRIADAPDVQLRSDDDYTERFLELYAQAVRCRLRSDRPVGATLSSGLDSGSVTALAARELRAQGQTLDAFTSAPLYPQVSQTFPNALVDELPLAHLTAVWAGNVQHIPLRAEAVTPMMGLERSLWLHDKPEYAASNMYWIVALLEESRLRGLGALLTAQLGNGGVSWSGDSIRILRLFRQRHWRAAVEALAEWKRAQHRSWWSGVKSELASPLKLWFSAPRSLAPWADYSPIHPAFARRIHLAQRMRATGVDRTFGRLSEPREQRIALIAVSAAMSGAFWHEAGAAYGLEVRDPTGDIRLVEFCVSVPEEQWIRAGQTRWLLRRSMEGLLPPEVQWNTRRGMQAADVVYRLLAERERVEAALERVARSDWARNVLDLDRMNRVWREARQQVTPSMHRDVTNILLRGLLAGIFILTLTE